MYFMQELGPEAEQFNERCKQLVAAVIAGLEPLRKNGKLTSHLHIFQDGSRRGTIYLLKEGTLSFTLGSKMLMYFDPGDLIGLEHALTTTTADIASDFAVIVDEYSIDSLLQHIRSDALRFAAWTEYLALISNLFSTLAASHMKEEITTPPDISAYRGGQTIIEQGSHAVDVYTLVEGEATAFVDGVQVGRILQGEIFGVIAALTGIPRTASVIAAKPCTVLSLPRENFVHLVKTRPSTFLKVVEDMARTMVELNEEVVSLSLSKF